MGYEKTWFSSTDELAMWGLSSQNSLRFTCRTEVAAEGTPVVRIMIALSLVSERKLCKTQPVPFTESSPDETIKFRQHQEST